jgi:hypothetical protein
VRAVRIAAQFGREVLHLLPGARDLEGQDEAPPAAPDASPVHWPSPGPSAPSPPPRASPRVRTPIRPATRSSCSPRSTSHRRVWMLEAADRDLAGPTRFMVWSGNSNVSTLHSGTVVQGLR